MIVWGTVPEINHGIAEFVGARIEGGWRGFSRHMAMGVIEGETLLAGVIFHNYNPEAHVIEFTAASITPRWLSRPVLWAMFDYAFNMGKCQLVVMRVSEQNKAWNGRGIQRILKAYGFKETRIDNLRGRGVAELIYTLTDEAWRLNRFHKENRVDVRAAA